MSSAFAADSMGSTEVSIYPFTVLARGRVPQAVEAIAGSHAPLAMPCALQRTK